MQIATPDSWYKVERLSDDVTLISEQFIEPYYRCNIWHVRGRDRDLLIDSGMGVVSLRQQVALMAERPVLARRQPRALRSHRQPSRVRGARDPPGRGRHPRRPEPARDARRHLCAEGRYLHRPAAAAGSGKPAYRIEPAPATRLLDEGDVIDLGDRHFEVLHLPGHSPGSIGLWEQRPASSSPATRSMTAPLSRRLPLRYPDLHRHHGSAARAAARIVHGGHFPSFDGARYAALIDDYVEGKRQMGCPSETAAR